jgi:hypothetical protein
VRSLSQEYDDRLNGEQMSPKKTNDGPSKSVCTQNGAYSSRATMSQLLTMTNPNRLKGLAASKTKALRRGTNPFGLYAHAATAQKDEDFELRQDFPIP